MKKHKNLFIRTLLYSLFIIFISLLSYFGKLPLVTNYLHDIENKTYDLLFTTKHSLNLCQKPPGDIVIIGIDAVSINKVGVPWPWPRQFHASLLDGLVKSKAKFVIFDIIFDTISPLSLQTQDIQGSSTFAKSSFDAGREDDIIFANSLKKAMNVFLACEAEPLSKSSYHPVLPIKAFLTSFDYDTGYLGNASVKYDSDNFVRRAKVIFPEYQKDPAVSSSISLRVYQKFLNKKAKINQEDIVEIHNKKIPSEFLINFYGPSETIKTVSYWQALEQVYKSQTNEFTDKIVFIGRTKLKASIDPFKSVRSPDSFATPFASLTPNFSGVEIQATILGNLIDNSYIKQVNKLTLFLFMLLIGGMTSIIVWKLRAKLVGCLTACSLFSILYIWFAFFFFYFLKTYIPTTFPTYGIILPIYFINLLDQYFIVDRERRRQAKIFRQLVPSQIADEIEGMDTEQLALGGKRTEITVLFTDIKNFTGLCEKSPPEIVVNVLNQFFTEMVKIIHKHNGLVDKFIGDAIMAIWGSPKTIEEKDQARLACQCALAMNEELNKLNKEWSKMGTVGDIATRIGINTDVAVTGNIGSLERVQYSAVGDGVNLASRLEGVNKIYGTGILLSEKTAKLLTGNFNLREIDTVIVPGKDVPTNIYELLPSSDHQEDLIKNYSSALNHYRNKNFDEAIKYWNICLKLNPNDSPSIVMLERTRKQKQLGIKDDWKPIWVIETK